MVEMAFARLVDVFEDKTNPNEETCVLVLCALRNSLKLFGCLLIRLLILWMDQRLSRKLRKKSMI